MQFQSQGQPSSSDFPNRQVRARRAVLALAVVPTLSAALLLGGLFASGSPVSATSRGAETSSAATTGSSAVKTSSVAVSTPQSLSKIVHHAPRSSITTARRHSRTARRVTASVHHAPTSSPTTTTRTAPSLANSVALSVSVSTITRTAPSLANSAALGTSVPTAASTALLAHLNPVANIAPSPNFLQSGQCTNSGSGWTCANPCVTSTLTWPIFTNDVACTNYVLAAINVARQMENLAPMVLPSNWYSLTPSQQLFVVADLERTARGLPPYLGLNAALSANAQSAALTNGDPSVAAGFAIGTDVQGYPAMGGTWSAGFSVLAADYIWMYDDGWGGSSAGTSNVVCTSAAAAGCWAHRDELLGFDPGFNPGVGLTCANCEMGTGFAQVSGSGSFVDLIEMPRATPPAMNFTWAANVVPFL